MSTALATVDQLTEIVFSVEEQFGTLVSNNLHFKQEAMFAMQTLKGNDYLFELAQKDPSSLKAAILNIGAIGLSLNPVSKLVYLVPRKKVCVDISYMGLIEIALASGSVLAAKAILVKAKDKFKYIDSFTPPEHDFDPFDDDRGAIRGVYCVAKLKNGQTLVDFMSLKEVYKIRDRSDAWVAYQANKIKSTPWHEYEEEMIKKTVIKRAYKGWPKTKQLDYAIAALNEHEGETFGGAKDITPPNPDEVEVLKRLLSRVHSGWSDRLLRYISQKDGASVASIDEMTGAQVRHSIEFITPYIQKAEADTKKKTETKDKQ